MRLLSAISLLRNLDSFPDNVIGESSLCEELIEERITRSWLRIRLLSDLT